MGTRQVAGEHLTRGLGALFVAWMVSLAIATSVEAAPPAFITAMPNTAAEPASGAGELSSPRGIVGNPDTGHVYVADLSNSRVNEYTAWGLFVKSWGWGVADGSAELQTCGPAEPEEAPDPALCRKGIAGSGKGQLNVPIGMAIDPTGNLYVYEQENVRVQKFSPAGEFMLMFGGDVNATKVAASAPQALRNVCPVDPGDVCQAGISGEEPSQLSGSVYDLIEYSPAANAILVGDKDGIQVFELDGTHRETIPFTGALAAFAGQSVNALDVDGDGNVYFSLSGVEDVFKINPTGEPLAPGKPGESKFEVGTPLGVAVDVDGNVFAIDDPPGDLPVHVARVVEFDETGAKLLPTKAEEDAAAQSGAGGQLFPYIPFHGPSLTAIATNICAGSEPPGNLYASFFTEVFSPTASWVSAYGTAPTGCEPPPPRAPEITAQFASAVGREEATVKAQINPRFWPDATYFVEYGTGRCSEGGCGSKAPLSAVPLTEKSVNGAVTTAGVFLEGLLPGTTYHYRFVAQSSGGGPVFGVDPDGREGPAQADLEEGLEATFTTFAAVGERASCVNDAVRAGPAALLPDCRAYEMVSPLDKGNGDVALWQGRNALVPQLFELDLSAPTGNRFSYSSTFGFGDPEAAPWVSTYLADRGPAGWSSKPLSPPRTETPVNILVLLQSEFNAISPDLCHAWFAHYSVGPLAAGAIENYANLYRRDNCGEAPSYLALTTVEPPKRSPEDYSELRVHGFSDDGSHAIFTANDELVKEAPSLKEGELLLYEHTPGGLRFVCYLPNGKAIGEACAAGTPAGNLGGNTSTVRNAISADGSRIFWTAHSGNPGFGADGGNPGQIYVRIDGRETRKVSTAKAPDPAWYWTASDDGSKAIFAFDSGPLKDQLYEFDVDSGTPTLIAKEVEGPMGASEDASRIYFASKEDLDGSGPAAAGGHNLYLYEADPGGGGGSVGFIMGLAAGDFLGTHVRPTPINNLPSQRSARVSADGLHAAFTSVASPTPTGYDNRDANGDEPTPQVYLYDAVEEELRCVSCNPSRARPVGEDVGGVFSEWISARLQGWEALGHAPRVLSEDGTRVFFESHDALVPRDTNGTWDVYQWEEAGKGTCTTSSATFSNASGGCVGLISAGTSAAKSTFLDADPSGDNAFFSTQSSLVGPDYGLNDVYVARVGGGFPEPPVRAPCEGDACQSPPAPRPDIAPSTESSSGPGNVVKRKPRRCPKGKRKARRAGKVRCVKRKSKASQRRRAAR